MKVKLEDLSAGDCVQIDAGFTRMSEGTAIVHVDAENGERYVYCGEGAHYLDGQVGSDGYLVGVTKGD